MGLAPVKAWPLAWIAMIPLWQLAHTAIAGRCRLRQALLLCAVWGVGYHGTALAWITGIHPMMWMGVPWLGSLAIALFSWAFITLWGAAIGITWLALIVTINRVMLSRYRLISEAVQILLGTALWCAVEWVWSKGPLYWTSLSYTQSPGNLWSLQLGQLSGPITLTASIVAVNGFLSYSLRSHSRQATDSRQVPAKGLDTNQRVSAASERIDKTTIDKTTIGKIAVGKIAVGKTPPGWIWAAAIFAAIHLIGFGLYSYPLADNPQRSLSVGLIQGNIPTAEKLSAIGVQASRKVYRQGYEALAQQGVDLVLTPEGSIPQVWDSFLQDQNLFQQAVIRRGVPLILGTFVHREIDNSQTPLTQSLITLAPTGEIAGRYNKVKLVPLGEYIPFENILGGIVGRLSPFGASMVPGDFDQRLETPLGPVAAGICYESAFTSLFRQQVRNGGEVIFTASNNDPYPPRQMMQHHAQDVMRAVETNRWAARVTNTGISGVVDPKGRTIWMSKPNEYGLYVADVFRRRSQTLYVRFGDWLTPLLLIMALIALIAAPRRLSE